ncbi:MAG: glycosyltransferase [Candidatus Thermochlorobacter sp.]
MSKYPKSETFDGCFIFFGDVRFDSRLQNILRSLSKKYSRLLLLQTSQQDESFEFERCQVRAFAIASSLRGAAKFLKFYRALGPEVLKIRAKFFCAEDVFSLPLAYQAARRRKARLYYDSRELFFALAQLAKKRIKQCFWAGVEAHCIRRAKVFTSGTRDADALVARYRIKRPEVIFNYPRYHAYRRSRTLHQRLQLPDSAVILLYQGIITEGRGIWKLLNMLTWLENRFVAVFIGDGDKLADLRQAIAARNYQQRAFAIGRVPHEELLRLTASADIGFALIEPLSESYNLALPNKLFEYVMASVPVVASDLPAMKEVVEAHHVGAVVSAHEEEKRIAECVLEVYENLEKYRSYCRKAREVFNWEAQEEQLLRFFS